MPYVAHAAFPLATGISPDRKMNWYTIKQVDCIEYRWKFDSDDSCHVLAGVFEDAHAALNCAKQIYVSLFYELMKQGFGIEGMGCSAYEMRFYDPEHDGNFENYVNNESFFFWNKRYAGGWLGPGVFEVNRSIDEFCDYRFMRGHIEARNDTEIDLANIDRPRFAYCQEAWEYLDTITLAENAWDHGLKMTIYCGLLEHLSDDRSKDGDMLAMLDKLVECVDSSELPPANKNSLKSFLNSGRKVSSRQRCRNLCAKYAKPEYSGYSRKKIIDDAYGVRSAFSHGEKIDRPGSPGVRYMKFIVLDVVENYMREKEGRLALDESSNEI